MKVCSVGFQIPFEDLLGACLKRTAWRCRFGVARVSVRQCDVTESVTLRDRDRGSRSTGRKGFSPEINPVLLSFMSSMRVSRSVISCGEMVRVPFRHSW